MLLLSRWANFSHRTPPASMWLERASARSSPAVGGLYCLIERKQAHGAVAQAGNYAACCTKAEGARLGGSEVWEFGGLGDFQTKQPPHDLICPPRQCQFRATCSKLAGKGRFKAALVSPTAYSPGIQVSRSPGGNRAPPLLTASRPSISIATAFRSRSLTAVV